MARNFHFAPKNSLTIFSKNAINHPGGADRFRAGAEENDERIKPFDRHSEANRRHRIAHVRPTDTRRGRARAKNRRRELDLKMKILVVDDFATMRKVVRNMLRGIGCDNVNEAENGQEGFRMAKTGEYGLIVSDWNMPVMTGLEFLKAVRADEKTKDIPFLMVTAESLKENIIQAIQAGASNYIVKPFTPQVFEEKLNLTFKS